MYIPYNNSCHSSATNSSCCSNNNTDSSCCSTSNIFCINNTVTTDASYHHHQSKFRQVRRKSAMEQQQQQQRSGGDDDDVQQQQQQGDGEAEEVRRRWLSSWNVPQQQQQQQQTRKQLNVWWLSLSLVLAAILFIFFTSSSSSSTVINVWAFQPINHATTTRRNVQYQQQQRPAVLSIHTSSIHNNNNNHPIPLYLARNRNNNNNRENRYQQSYSISTTDPTIITTAPTSSRGGSINKRNNNKNKSQLRWYPNIFASTGSTNSRFEAQKQPNNDTTNDSDLDDDDDDDLDTILMELEQHSVTLMAYFIRKRLSQQSQSQQQQQQHGKDIHLSHDTTTGASTTTDVPTFNTSNVFSNWTTTNPNNNNIQEMVHGRFMDLTCTEQGEKILEDLFFLNDPNDFAALTNIIDHMNDKTKDVLLLFLSNSNINNNNTSYNTDQDDMTRNYNNNNIIANSIIRGAIMVLQSTCVMGTQVGVKGPPEQLRRMVEHLSDPVVSLVTPQEQLVQDYIFWNKDSVRRLKYRVDRTPAIQLLSTMKWKQTPQGAYDLLVAIGVWEKHEDLALLRSGFPIRFTSNEERIANQIIQAYAGNSTTATSKQSSSLDIDTILGIRRDLRQLKVYTIDGADAAEIDDGISIEKIDDDSSSNNHRYRIWIHIADAESWAPPDSDLFEMARRRVTSLYLPHGSISMFPTKIATDIMSLKVNDDVRALSLGVELNDDGSIIESSLLLTPSLIRVSYRLTYDEVDEMLEEGIGYNEEWEIGALLMTAMKRRAFRIQNGSSEGMVPNPVPSSSVSIYRDESSPDSIGISVSIEISHNSALNKTASAEQSATKMSSLENPASSAYLLVTETMILAGEGIGVWKRVLDNEVCTGASRMNNFLRLPYRAQSPPNFQGRSRERNVMLDLLESHAGMGWCHAWYTRRFLESVSVKEHPAPHSGLGLGCYVQWSSPIRRLSDLQVHAAVKRYLRRRKVQQLLQGGEKPPIDVRAVDLGLSDKHFQNGVLMTESIALNDVDTDLDFMDGIGLVGAAKKLQRQSQNYWLLEYIKRAKEANPDTTFNVVVLGCVDPERYQFAIYVKELGLEHRYLSPAGRLEPGAEFRVKVDSVTPRSGLLTFVRVI